MKSSEDQRLEFSEEQSTGMFKLPHVWEVEYMMNVINPNMNF